MSHWDPSSSFLLELFINNNLKLNFRFNQHSIFYEIINIPGWIITGFVLNTSCLLIENIEVVLEDN